MTENHDPGRVAVVDLDAGSGQVEAAVDTIAADWDRPPC